MPLIEKINIASLMAGDTICHNNKEMTVCKKDIRRGFCGLTVFGDSYRLGTIPILRVLKSFKELQRYKISILLKHK